jgi:polysaccharide export outer membrane protein
MNAQWTVRNRGSAKLTANKRLRERRGGLTQLGWWIGVVAVLAQLVGCTEARKSDANAEGPNGLFRPYTERDVTATEYRVAPPDKLMIRAPGIKEMDNVVTQIRPDGRITLNLLRDVYVANKTPDEIGRMLTDAMSKYYNNVQVTVEVADYASKFYEVFGLAVRDGGRKPYTGRNTVVAALAGAGFNERAWPQQVSISRPPKDGRPRGTVIVDMQRMYTTGDTRQNYLLEEGDIVYVPDSPLEAWADTTRLVLSPLPLPGGAGQSVAPGAGPR